MELPGKSASCLASAYLWAGIIGFLVVGGLACVVGESLRDWEFHYRIHLAMLGARDADLTGENAVWFTRVLFSHPWVIYFPTVALAVGLLANRKKSVASVVRLCFVAVFVTVLIGYVAAYLPVAMPGWWQTGRPEEVIEATKRAADFDRSAGVWEMKRIEEEKGNNPP